MASDSGDHRSHSVTAEQLLLQSGLGAEAVKEVLHDTSPAAQQTPPPPAPPAHTLSAAAEASSPVPLRQQLGLPGSRHVSPSPAYLPSSAAASRSPSAAWGAGAAGGAGPPPAYDLTQRIHDASTGITSTAALLRSSSAMSTVSARPIRTPVEIPSLPLHSLRRDVSPRREASSAATSVVKIPFPASIPGPSPQPALATPMPSVVRSLSPYLQGASPCDVSTAAAGVPPPPPLLPPGFGHEGVRAAAEGIMRQGTDAFWESFADEWLQLLPSFDANLNRVLGGNSC